MSKEIYISSTPHETRLAIVENDELAEIYYERENEYTLAGSIYNGRVTRVLPGMQSSFVDIGLERDAFLYITDFMEEAGDSAEFDGDGKASGRRDAPRVERVPRPEAVAGGDAEAATPLAERSGSERSGTERGAGERERGERGGRGRRERGRGGRDGQPVRSGDAALPIDAEPAMEAAPRVTNSLDGDAGEVGEGEPGADGNRRWRGRRGRRRGRGEDGPAVEGVEGQTSAAEEPVEAAGEDVPAVETRADRPRRDRGGDRERGGERDRHSEVRSRFAPRGAGRGGDADDETVDLQGSAAEPFLLPGESLSKYRKNEDGSPVAAAKSFGTPVSAVTPSSEVKPLVGYDGGAVLPGETLSRRGGASASTGESRGGDLGRGRGERGGSDRGGRGERGGRGGRREEGGRGGGESPPRRESNSASVAPRAALDPAEAVQPAVTSQHEPEPFELTMHTAQHGGEAFEQETYAAPAEKHATPAEGQAAESEYEPGEDSSASFRVDPTPPREFRMPWSKAPVEKKPVAEEVPATEEFTAIEASGEMNSAPAAPVRGGERNAATPVAHEGAVQSVTLAESAKHAVLPSHNFAPGQGQLEEEMMDDEDGDVPALHASAYHEEIEEETIEGGADLGAMLREMSIDQITRPPEPAGGEEDDFDIDERELEEDEFASSGDDEEGDATEGEAAEFEGGDAAGGEGGGAGGEAGARTEGQRDGQRSGDRARRDGGRRGGRDRGGRDRGGRDGGRDSGRARSTGGERSHGGGGRMSRSQAQTANLPAISDLLKPGQELLVQIAKEPIAKKGARITSHIALPGRFLVFMPTVSHTGVSRKIESDAERRRLKEILLSERGEASGGFIVRTAAAGASEEELRSDLRFLLNLWADIKSRSESSKSPALIYHDLNLVERILRDQVTDNFSAIWVDTEDAYERVLRFLQRFQPSLIRRVKLYTKETPLFEQFGITAEIDKALRSKVWLKSGGSIVINQTEALVAIDINTGKYVGKTARLEDTIVKTNMDAIPEIVRQIRLRDLGGIIIIDFIDMDDRKNRHKVLAALEEELKSDRAPSKVLPFNDFGLIAITRKRVKQSLERTLSTTCGVCQGTGMTKSPVTVANDIYIEMRKMQKHLDRGDVMLRVHPEVVKQLKAPGTKWLQEMEEMVGKTILVKSDPSLHPEQFDIH